MLLHLPSGWDVYCMLSHVILFQKRDQSHGNEHMQRVLLSNHRPVLCMELCQGPALELGPQFESGQSAISKSDEPGPEM